MLWDFNINTQYSLNTPFIGTFFSVQSLWHNIRTQHHFFNLRRKVQISLTFLLEVWDERKLVNSSCLSLRLINSDLYFFFILDSFRTSDLAESFKKLSLLATISSNKFLKKFSLMSASVSILFLCFFLNIKFN